MNRQRKHLIILLTLLAVLCSLRLNAQEPPYYFSIYQGNITMTPTKVSGYRWNGTKWVKETGFSASSYATYEIGMWTSSQNPTTTASNPGTVTTINGGTVNIVNQTNVSTVLSNWDTRASGQSRRYTTNKITITCNVQYQIQLNNVWLTANNCIEFQPHKEGAKLEIYLKGDNRVHNIFYCSNTKILSGESGSPVSCTDAHIMFYDQDGASGVAKKGTLTLGGTTDTNNHYHSVIGGNDDTALQDSRGIEFYGGTIFAGAKLADNCTAIGAGGNGVGIVKVAGGTITAVTSSTGCAIGGGIGWSNTGGPGTVTISGGTVYAYNHGYSQSGTFVPAAALGGASSYQADGSIGTVTISGGTVTAQCTGGTAIGGGGSTNAAGGAATVTISGGTVSAKSISGTVNGVSVNASTAIGGGTGKTAGGNVTFKMTAGTLKSGSVGGGKKTSASNAYGSGTVTISGGTINAQFVLSRPASGSSTFTMSGGTIGGLLSGYTYLQSDGYALWMEAGTATIKGSAKISGCTGAAYGGAVYMSAGTFNMEAGTIEKCSASNRGGAVYMGGGTFNLSGGTIGGSDATYANTAVNYGGGLFMNGGTFNMTGGNIKYNQVTVNNGGGVFINTGGIATIKGGTIQGNTAVTLGGGICVNPGNGVTTTINSDNAAVTISNNSAAYGGGVEVHTGTLTVSKTNNNLNIQSNTATASGGGVYVNGGTVNVTGANISSNTAANHGGGICSNGGAVTLTSATVNSNTATGGNGGGVYAAASVTVTSSTLSGNKATANGGGGIYTSSTVNIGGTSSAKSKLTSNQARLGGGVYAASGGSVTVGYGNIGESSTGNTASADGGGIYAVGAVTLNTGALVQCNTATTNGGGVYVNNGTFTMNAGTIGGSGLANVATNGNGGGVYVTGSSSTVTVKGNVTYNTATNGNGGGIYAAGNSTMVTSGTVSNNQAKNGGGLYAASGSVTLTTSTFQSNQATTQHGGGIYGAGGNITVNAGSIASNTANSGNGGGVYATSGTITFNSTAKAIPTFTGNSAVNGGVLYMEGGTCNINAGILGGTHANRNKATNSGGAIYADNGIVNFVDGTISYNTAAASGGGLYVATAGTLNMTGNVTLNYNHVPATKHGGGVYLAGVLKIGSTTARTVSAQYNFADGTVDTDPSTVTISSTNRNNVYLPVPEVNANHTDVITVVKNGLTTSTRVGFSVPSNFVPVIYCNEASPYTYLTSFLTPIADGGMKETVFDDAEKYTTVHYADNSFYDPQHIYLSGGTWVDHVNDLTVAPAGFSVSGNNVTISSSDGLAWLIKYINGISPVTTSPNTGVNVTLDADLDMGDYAWVPMGSDAYSGTGTVFTGTFNGQGHTISNIICQYLGTQTGTSLGLFGTVGSSATVENVQLKGAKLNTSNMSSGSAQLGSVAGQITGGTIQCCVSEATISTLHSGTVMGGLVGQQSGGEVHSCYAAPKMTGYEMGGLVGELTSGNLYNSFANPQFTYKGSGYMGGLVGVNAGTVENCYVRLLGTAPASNFGWLVGDNTNGDINFSYSPNASYTISGKEGNQDGLGTYSVTTSNAYDYKIHDNQVTATNDYIPDMPNKQLVKTLNNWVTQDATHKSTYSKWLRPTTQVINGDYPLLRLTAFNAVAANNGEAFLDYGDINNHIGDYKLSNQAICLYGSRANVVTNVGINTNASLYIDQDAVITQAGDIQAYVGVTLDNSAGTEGANPSFGDPNNPDAIDWHFFSSVLTAAPIGLVYGDENTYGYGVYPSWNATFTAPNAANGYFPTNLDNYYNEWDLYAYSECEYHWINLKRNTNSHWHEDFDHGHITTYTNETIFTPGHGYMVALAEENYLQAYGMLNRHPNIDNPLSIALDYTPEISWTTRQGHNLLGNPYQSYLDFDEFAELNSNLWSGGETNAFYIIIDEDQKDYIYCAYNESNNEFTAPKYLHPHQGFMVIVDAPNLSAKFDDRMRNITATGSSFRDGERPNYPLVNLFATDGNGNRDMVTVELGRPDRGGAQKQQSMRTSTGSLWCSYEGKDYAIAFTQPGLEAANIRFMSDVDGEYTMTWNTQNGDFSYLHLIDNMTGSDIDCLTTEEYKFTSRTTDYASRFRLTFGYTGIEEPEAPEPVEGPTNFAFMMNGELVVNGEGSLQLYDLSGRMLTTYKTYGAQTTVSLPELSAGVYLLRLTNDNGTRTQKIILD